MALTRKFLAALGIEADKIDEIIDAHTETVNALKEERNQYKEAHDALPGVQKELDDLKKAAEQNGENPYKAQYEELKQEYEDYKNDVSAKELARTKQEAYKVLLKDAGVSEKRIASILKVTSVDDLELDKDGKFKDAEELTKKIKDEWQDFIVKEGTKGAETKTPPAGGGNDHTPSRAAMVAKKHYEAIYGTKGEDK